MCRITDSFKDTLGEGEHTFATSNTTATTVVAANELSIAIGNYFPTGQEKNPQHPGNGEYTTKEAVGDREKKLEESFVF